MKSSDFLIVGAGINGLLMARNLLAAGATVTLVERGEVAREASWAGGGIVSPLYPWRYPPAITALANWAQAFYPQLVAQLKEETGCDAEFSNSGLLMLDAADQSAALVWAGKQQHEMEAWSRQQITQHEPALAPGYKLGLWMPRVGNVRNPRLCQALLASLLRDAQFNLLTQTHVNKLICKPGGAETVRAVQVSAGSGGSQTTLSAGTVVLTAGAWSQLLLDDLALRTDIAPVKGQMLLYKFDQPPIQSIVLTQGRYLIPRRDGHVLVGSTLEYEDFDKTPTEEARQYLRQSAIAMLPELEYMEPVGHWAGLRPGSEGGVPYIGRLAPYTNLFINAGQFRNGLVLAPASARLLTEILLNEDAFIDPIPYAPVTHYQLKQSCQDKGCLVSRDRVS